MVMHPAGKSGDAGSIPVRASSIDSLFAADQSCKRRLAVECGKAPALGTIISTGARFDADGNALKSRTIPGAGH